LSTPPELGEAADRVLEIVGPSGQAAVSVTRHLQALTRFANSFIHQNVEDESVSVHLTLSVDGRQASAATDRTDTEALRRLVDSARDAAAVRPVDPAWPGLAPPAPPAGDPDVHFDRATADAGPDARAGVVAAFVEAGGGLESAGFCETAVVESHFANSAGQRVGSRATSAAVDGIQRHGRSDGVASAYSSRLADLDGDAAGRRAAERARAGVEPIELPAGRYEVVLEPRAVAYTLDFFSYYGFNARAVLEGRSFASVGEQQLDPAVSLWDDATDPRQLGIGFDEDGTPKAKTPLVESGVVVGLTHDRRTAARAGGQARSTGHAVGGGEAFGAIATSLFLGTKGPTVGPPALISQVQRGLLVCDFWYTRVLDPKTLVATGLTRNGVFLIEDGQVGPAVSNLRFTQSYVAALAPGKVLGVGNDAALAPGGLHVALNHAPSLRLAQWNFTGNASG
jgi:predicted Zn-dependent protease